MNILKERHLPAPRISVVIPTYNRARYVAEALKSVFAQTFKDCEVIVVDDGSTDNTQEALAPYRGRIRYLYQENQGIGSARNAGVKAARGRFVAFLDSDDMWEPQTLEKIMEVFQDNPKVGLVSIMGREIGPQGTRTRRMSRKRSPGPYYSTKSLLWSDSGRYSWFSVRRSLLNAVGGFDEELRSAEECDLCLRLSFHTQMVGVPEPLLLRRIHDENLSLDKGTNARMWLRILEKLKREHPEFVREHPWVYRRAVGKENLRLGRELLATYAGNPKSLGEARRALRQSIRAYPFFLRAYVYLTWSYLFPSTYGAWRRWESQRR